MEPRVSFVVTNYNYGRYVGQAISSLLAQTFTAIEIIVIDDHSSDNSLEVIAPYAHDPRVRVIQHAHNRGSIASYNEGLSLARGEIVGVFDADDYAVSSNAVSAQVALFDADPQLGFVYSAFELVDCRGQIFRRCQDSVVNVIRDGLTEFTRLAFLNTVPHSGTLVRRSCHEEVGYYDERLPYAGDWDLWLRLAARFRVGYVAAPLYAYRVHPNNMTVRGKGPAEATTERLLALAKGFEYLSPDAPLDVRRLQPAATRTALLCSTWNDRSFGRVRRSWAGLIDAVLRAPSLLTTRDAYVALMKLILLTLVGQPRYERLSHVRRATT